MKINELENRFQKIEEINYDATDINEFQDKVFALEKEVQDGIDFPDNPREKKGFEKLMQKIIRFKEENDFFDPDTERSFMFPDGMDED